jgi:hypothetical protein
MNAPSSSGTSAEAGWGEHGSVQGRTTHVVVHVGAKVAVDGAGWEAAARVMAMGGFYELR